MKIFNSIMATLGLLVAAGSAQAQLFVTLDTTAFDLAQGASVNASGRITAFGGIGGLPTSWYMGGTNISFTGPSSLVTGDATPFYTPNFYFAHDTDGSNPANDGLINGGESLSLSGLSTDLFTINVDPGADIGTYIGEFDVLDGTGHQLGSTSFTVNVSASSTPGTPEPGSTTLLLVGCAAVGAIRKRKRGVRGA